MVAPKLLGLKSPVSGISKQVSLPLAAARAGRIAKAYFVALRVGPRHPLFPASPSHMLRTAFSRSLSTAAAAGLRVAVVGSGPSGFYTAKYLLKEDPTCTVDVLDALPNPYGAAAAQVAPWLPHLRPLPSSLFLSLSLSLSLHLPHLRPLPSSLSHFSLLLSSLPALSPNSSSCSHSLLWQAWCALAWRQTTQR